MRDKASVVVDEGKIKNLQKESSREGGLKDEGGFDEGLLNSISEIYNSVETHTLSSDPSHADEKSPEWISELKTRYVSGKIDELQLRKNHSEDKIKNHVGEFVRSQTERMSDNIYLTPALDNDFFNKFAVSGEKMPLDDLKKALQQFRSLTDMTRGGVTAAMIANQGNDAEREALQNRYEEGGGESGKPHIELLDDSLKAMVDLAAGKDTDFSPEVKIPRRVEARVNNANDIRDYENNDGVIFSSTLKARRGQNSLYSGTFIDKEGITGSITTGNHPEFVAASVDGVSAAHEGKAPFMLGGMLEISRNIIKDSTYPEEGKQAKIEAIRPYYDDHLGKGLVSDILDGKFEGQSIMKVISRQKQEAKKLTPEEWKTNRMDITELAHSNDANEGVVKSVMDQKSVEDMFWAYDAAKKGFEGFIKNQGEFWNGIANNLEKGGEVIRSSDSKSSGMTKSVSDSKFLAMARRRGGSMGSSDMPPEFLRKLNINDGYASFSSASSLSSLEGEGINDNLNKSPNTTLSESSGFQEREKAPSSYKQKREEELSKTGFDRSGGRM